MPYSLWTEVDSPLAKRKAGLCYRGCKYFINEHAMSSRFNANELRGLKSSMLIFNMAVTKLFSYNSSCQNAHIDGICYQSLSLTCHGTLEIRLILEIWRNWHQTVKYSNEVCLASGGKGRHQPTVTAQMTFKWAERCHRKGTSASVCPWSMPPYGTVICKCQSQHYTSTEECIPLVSNE